MRSPQREERRRKKLHYEAYFESNKNKTSKLWEGIRALVNTSASKSSNIKLIDENDCMISDKGVIANTFNHHFSTIGSNVGNSILSGHGHFTDYLNVRDVNNKPHLNPPNTFYLGPTIPEEIDKLIDS